MKLHYLRFCLLLLLTACQPLDSARPRSAAATIPAATATTALPPVTTDPLDVQGFIQRIHDPVLAKEGERYYLFSTGSRLIMICSADMIEWTWCGRVFDQNPDWLTAAVPGLETGDLWAPDISYFNGKWQLYYAGSTFGSNRSAIGLATNVTLDPESPDYAWEDEGLVIASQPTNNWNAIDPNFILDEDGQPWLAFGSYWSGIKLRKLDPATGKPANDDTTLYSLAQRVGGSTAIEAPFLLHRGDYYYLFVSFDACCQGAESTYHVRVGRSSTITGPYVDQAGVPMLEGGGTLILSAYDRWRGPGHNGIYHDEAGTDWLVYHAYDAKEVGIPKLRIEAIEWDAAGWPQLSSQK